MFLGPPSQVLFVHPKYSLGFLGSPQVECIWGLQFLTAVRAWPVALTSLGLAGCRHQPTRDAAFLSRWPVSLWSSSPSGPVWQCLSLLLFQKYFAQQSCWTSVAHSPCPTAHLPRMGSSSRRGVVKGVSGSTSHFSLDALLLQTPGPFCHLVQS